MNACIAITCIFGHSHIKNDVHIVTFQIKTAFIMYYDIISSNDLIKREPSDP